MTPPPEPPMSETPTLPAALLELLDEYRVRVSAVMLLPRSQRGAALLARDTAFAALEAELSSLVRDAAYLKQLDVAYFAADFDDEQCADKVVLKFALPRGTTVGSDLRETLDRAAAQSPSPAPEAR